MCLVIVRRVSFQTVDDDGKGPCKRMDVKTRQFVKHIVAQDLHPVGKIQTDGQRLPDKMIHHCHLPTRMSHHSSHVAVIECSQVFFREFDLLVLNAFFHILL